MIVYGDKKAAKLGSSLQGFTVLININSETLTGVRYLVIFNRFSQNLVEKHPHINQLQWNLTTLTPLTLTFFYLSEVVVMAFQR